MAIEISGQRYEIVIGTDVSQPEVRNGAFLEMRPLARPEKGPLLIAFRDNATGKVTISMHREDVEVEVLTYFLTVAAKELSPDHWPLWENPA